MIKKLIFLILVLTVLGTGAAVLPAQQGQRSHLMQNLRFGLFMAENNLFEARMILRFKAEIGLSDEQAKKIENMMLAYDETAIRREADMKVLELHFASLLKNDKVNRREMEKMAREIGDMRTNTQIDHLNYLLDIRDTLTPEQIAKLEQLKMKGRQMIRERLMERRPDRHLPPPPEKKNPAEGD